MEQVVWRAVAIFSLIGCLVFFGMLFLAFILYIGDKEAETHF